MSHDDEISNSPTKWVAKHIDQYLETDGQKGHIYHGTPTLLLTTRGRKSGKLRRTALIYGESEGRYLLVPSNGGAHEPPAWLLNLLDNPDVEIQVNADKFPAKARLATDAEKPALWEIMTKIFPRYNTYQKQAGDRDIPVVIIERSN